MAWIIILIIITIIVGNRADIVVKDYERKSLLLTDMLMPIDNNLLVKEYYKINNTKWKNVAY